MTSPLILSALLLSGQFLSAQRDYQAGHGIDSFYLSYAVSGMGSNTGNLEPTLEIHGNKFGYSLQQNSYFIKRSKEPVLLRTGLVRVSSIDSILILLKDFKDTAIFKSNPCIMSGVITFITVARGHDTTKFELANTTHPIVVKIADILNQYLPEDRKLTQSAKELISEDDCLAYLRKKNVAIGNSQRLQNLDDRRDRRLIRRLPTKTFR